MELWQHALYALAIVVVALIGWRAWQAQRNKSERFRDLYECADRCLSTVAQDRDQAKAALTKYAREAHQLTEERDRAGARAQSAEQSRRAYKGHNKRLRSENRALKERIAELEGEG